MPTDPTPDPNASHDPYVEVRDGQFYVRGSDVRLERLILAWSHVPAPEALRGQFPSLSMAAIYGAIAYALGHKDELDRLTAEYQQKHPEEAAAGRGMGYTFHRQEGGTATHAEGDPFDRFTQRARKVMGLAREEAQRLNHNYIGTEHLLLGLVREGDGVAAKVLYSMHVELNAVRAAVEHIIGRGDRIVLGDVGLTPRAKKVFELARDEAQRMGHRYLGTEHLLLGLVREGEGIAAGVLESLGVNLEKLRVVTITMVGAHPSLLTEHAQEATTTRPMSGGVSDRDRFDKFDVSARKTLSLAQEEAQRFNHNYIGTEHLLLGLVRDGDSTAAKVLQRMDIELNAVRSAVEHIIGRGDRIVLGDIGLTPRAKKVIELAVDEARHRNAGYIGTEHLLLGTIREGEGIAG
ncbi:MAG TPA: Clp protease N-terminal domain-containing protein, partial [Ktedonobacterales bacterium]|nr:Clp protease N-terminal domain-containing protein [Ktedonobacterales bacterium]